jgi:hypothetical protein
MSILEPAHKIYGEAKPTRLLAHCSCCTPAAAVTVHEDGTRRCHISGQKTPASADVPELLEMRRAYERHMLSLARACELH